LTGKFWILGISSSSGALKTREENVRLGVLTAVAVKDAVFWDIKSRAAAVRSWRLTA
jgi:hypothetical protein